MTLDQIGTAFDATRGVALAFALAWGARKATRWGGRHPRVVAVAFVAATLVAVAWAEYNNVGIRETEYNSLNDAYDLAPPDRKEAMREIAVQAGSRREIYSMSHRQRDRFLHAGGYCRVSFEPACTPPPRGSGHWLDGREALAHLNDPHAAQRCDPRRCTWLLDGR
jgi:hypothetical protein